MNISKVQLSLDLANLVLLLVAITSVLVAMRQIGVSKRISQETVAKEIHRDYIKMALDNPDLSIGRYDKDDPVSVDKYDSFVSFMLYSFDEMLTISPREDWFKIVQYQVQLHEDYLRPILHKNCGDSYRSGYSDVLLDLVDEVFECLDAKDTSENCSFKYI